MKAITIFAVLLFAGCVGIGPDEAGYRDVVTITYTAADANTNEVLLEAQSLTFIMVRGQSGLGYDFEEAITGMAVNESKTFTSKADDGRSYNEDATAGRIFTDIPAVREIDVPSLNGFLGFEAEVGTEFELPFYPAVVESIEGDTATYRLKAEQGQRDELPDLGSTLVTTTDGDTMTQTLEPVIGATFVIQPPSPFDPRTPLDLAVGSYKVTGAEGDQLLLKYNPTLNPELLDKDVRFTVTVTGIDKTSDGVEPIDGNYGARYSPQILGEPTEINVSIQGDHDHGDDHGDHTH